MKPVDQLSRLGQVGHSGFDRGDRDRLGLRQMISLQRLDLPGFCGERLAYFPGVSLEGYGALEPER